MQKYIKKIAFYIMAIGLVFTLSCINGGETEERTFDDELAELDSMLQKLIDSGYDIDTTNIGVYYIIKEEGEGPFPKPGETCVIDLQGFFPNGNKFIDSKDYYTNGRWKFLYGQRQWHMTPGLESGIGQMNEGAKIEMIIPSNLAFGEKGTKTIPPYTTLIYKSKMHELNPVDD